MHVCSFVATHMSKVAVEGGKVLLHQHLELVHADVNSLHSNSEEKAKAVVCQHLNKHRKCIFSGHLHMKKQANKEIIRKERRKKRQMNKER